MFGNFNYNSIWSISKNGVKLENVMTLITQKNVELTERLKWITNLIFFTMTCPRHAHIQGRIQDLKLGGHT